jgi:uncharacterized membrane protein
MNTTPTDVPGPRADLHPTVGRRAWHAIRARIFGGLLLVLPILVTFWVIHWLYSGLETYVIDPLAQLVLWKVQGRQPETELPPWFEMYAAPLIALLVVLLLLYGLGFFVRSRLRRVLDWFLLRLPVISVVYNGVRKVMQALEGQPGRQRPQRAVLVAFPHPGMRVPAFVTGTCRDVETQKVILCVYVPTTPVPTSGYFLLVPEDEVTELNWTPEQALQAIISAGLTAPPEVRYFKTGLAPTIDSAAARPTSAVLPDQRADGQPPLPRIGEAR